MNKYLIVVNEKFVHAEIADDKYINDYFNHSFSSGGCEWNFANGEFVVGVYKAVDADTALKEASEDFCIDKRALYSYKII